MGIGKLHVFARTLHRWSLWFVVILGLVQMTTGLTMKYPGMVPFVDPTGARLLHVQTAGYFALFFGIQMLTGMLMYITPWLSKKNRPPQPPTARPN